MITKLNRNMLAAGNLRNRKKQYVSLILGILLAMTFVCTVPAVNQCMQRSNEVYSDRLMGRQDYLLVGTHTGDLDILAENGVTWDESGTIHVMGYGWTNDTEMGISIGWMDENAEDLYYLQLLEGRMPERSDEILLERYVKMRLFPEAKLGDRLTFHMGENQESGIRDLHKEKSYTLVGIAENRKSYFQNHWSGIDQTLRSIPGAYTGKSTEGDTQILLMQGTRGYDPFDPILENVRQLQTNHEWADPGQDIQRYGSLVVLLGMLLTALTCFGIAGAFSSSLKDRSYQIGLLRALGATRVQILSLYGREVLLLTVFSLPLALGLAWTFTWAFTRMIGAEIVFRPTWKVFLEGAGLSLACVILSAAFPLITACSASPMQAIRTGSRVTARKPISSRKFFQPARLFAARNLRFHKGRLILVSLILAGTQVLCCIFGTFYELDKFHRAYDLYDSDFDVSLSAYAHHGLGFINKLEYNPFLTEEDKAILEALPEIQEVRGEKRCEANLLISGEFPRYLALQEYMYGTFSRYGSFKRILPDQDLTKENYREVLEGEWNPEYLQLREQQGYAQELFNLSMEAKPDTHILSLESQVTEGRIDLSKLNTGEEILLRATENIGIYVDGSRQNPYLRLLDMEEKSWRAFRQRNKILETAELPCHAGDTITVSILCQEESGEILRSDRRVRIGAILQSDDMCSTQLLTTVEGFDSFGLPIGYLSFQLDTKEPLSLEEDRTLLSQLESMFPGYRVYSMMVAPVCFPAQGGRHGDYRKETAEEADR